MAKLSLEQYVAARSARLGHLGLTYKITFFTSVANMFLILSFGPSAGTAAKLALAVLVAATGAYAILAVRSALDDLKALTEDALDELAGSNYGARLKQIPIGLFAVVSAICIVAIVVTQLLTILSV